jgi:single-strand DNA-binding protein
MNRITLVGYLGKDAEQRETKNNVPFTVLSVATKKSWKDRAGEWQSRTEWHRCLVWRPKLATFAASLAKGAHVQVEGELLNREYQKDGVTQRSVEVRTHSSFLLDRVGGDHRAAAQGA